MSSTNSSSRATIPTPPTSSASQPTQESAYYQQVMQAKPMTPAQIKAHGDVKTKIGVLWFIGAVCVSLIVIGGIAMIVNPEQSKDIWIIIGPILSSAIMGTIAFLTGEKMTNKK